MDQTAENRAKLLDLIKERGHISVPNDVAWKNATADLMMKFTTGQLGEIEATMTDGERRNWIFVMAHVLDADTFLHITKKTMLRRMFLAWMEDETESLNEAWADVGRKEAEMKRERGEFEDRIQRLEEEMAGLEDSRGYWQRVASERTAEAQALKQRVRELEAMVAPALAMREAAANLLKATDGMLAE